MGERLAFIYLSLGGRIGRRDYWVYFVLPAVAVGLLRLFPGFFDGSPLEIVLILIIAWPAIAVQAKRWHDLDFSGWWVLINAAPVAGWLIALAVNGFVRGTRGENQYGEDPFGEVGD